MKEDQERTPLRTILQNFLNHIENLESQRSSKDSYESEFQELKLFSESLKHIEEFSCSEGEKDVNRKKNRYKDILPFNISRVILSDYAGVPGSDYINANYIKGASGSLAYIASQGPLPNTVNDFWRMVVQCEVQVIVMACNEEESGKHKCENYWVESDTEEKQYGMVTIRLLKASTVCPDFSVRTMKLMYLNTQSQKEERTVCQFHYCAWPDHGVPPLVRPLLDMVRLVRDTQASETLPVLIHCSAGCGRTGTICAIDYVWGLLRAGKLTKDFSLFSLVRNMRKQRIAMVQTKEQYVLVHQAVRELFREQLKMIDSHPYENIDCNGMPLVKEADPIYDTVGTPYQVSVEEKQDEKEKSSTESLIQAPPLPSKKKILHSASKEEKEVENLSEKQRLVEQGDSSCESITSSNGSCASGHKLKIAKLKSLFERSSSSRESRRNLSKQSQVSRSHSVGAVWKPPSITESKPAAMPEIKMQVKPARLNLTQGPSCSPSKPSKPVKSVKSKLAPQIKRSKSMKVIGSDERNVLTIAPDDSKLKQNVCDKKVPGRRSVPAGPEPARDMRERRLSLESIVDELKESTKKNLQKDHSQLIERTDLLLDEQTRKFLQDCRHYLFGADKNSKSKSNATSGFKERRNSFCQAVNKVKVKQNGESKDYEAAWPDALKKPALVRSYTAVDMRPSTNRTPVKYTAHIHEPKLSNPPKSVSKHQHHHHHHHNPETSQNSQYIPSSEAKSSMAQQLVTSPQNVPLYQNIPFLGIKQTSHHSSPNAGSKTQEIYGGIGCKGKNSPSSMKSDEKKSKNSKQVPSQVLPSNQSVLSTRKNISSEGLVSSNTVKEKIPPHLPQHIRQKTTPPVEMISLSEPQKDLIKKPDREIKSAVKHPYVSNTFPLQASKSVSSGYSSSSSMERAPRQPRINAEFRKSDPIIQNYSLGLGSKCNPSSQGANAPPKSEQEISAKPYLIPPIGPRLKQTPNSRPSISVIKNRPPFPPPYQAACASSANFSELCNYEALRSGRSPNPMKANVPSNVPNISNNILPPPPYHSSNVSNSRNLSSCNSSVRTPVNKNSSASDSRILPPDHRYNDPPGSSQTNRNHSVHSHSHVHSQSLQSSDPQKTPLSVSNNWTPNKTPSPMQVLSSTTSDDVSPKTNRNKHSDAPNPKSNIDLSGVRMRHGSRDDLALCVTGPNPPNRVKRHASVVLSRYSLIESSDHTPSQLAAWNSTQVNGFTRNPTTANQHHHHHHHPPSPQQDKIKEYEKWSEAPGIDLDKVAATLSEKESDSSEFMRKTLEGLHIRKKIPSNPSGSPDNGASNSKQLGTQQQSNPSTPFKKQQYL